MITMPVVGQFRFLCDECGTVFYLPAKGIKKMTPVALFDPIIFSHNIVLVGNIKGIGDDCCLRNWGEYERDEYMQALSALDVRKD